MAVGNDSDGAQLRGAECMGENQKDAVYTMGYNTAYVRMQERFAQQNSVTFLIPHLLPNQRLLDIGCGAGFLSARMANAVAPGELVGIDIEQSQVDIARETAAQKNVDNARFRVADALDLPFADSSFDVAHLGGVLMHVADVEAALAEAMRVLKPGGLLACRDLMPESSFAHPELGVMQSSFDAFIDLVAADGGHPSIARDIKGRLKQAGFTDVRVSHAIETYDDAEELDIFSAIIRQWFLSDVVDAAQEYGLMTANMKLEIAKCLEQWRKHPAALAGVASCQALAIRP